MSFRIGRFAAVATIVSATAMVGLAFVQHSVRRAFSQPLEPRFMLLSGPVLDLGSGRPGEQVFGEIIVSNAGESPLSFAGHASCGCSKLVPDTGLLAKGETLSIQVAIGLKTRGQQASVRVDFDTNDPSNPHVGCQVQASCRPLLDIFPQSMAFGDIAEGTGSTRVIRVRTVEGGSSLPLGELTIRCPHPHVRVSRGDVSKGQMSLVVEIVPEAPRGTVVSDIDLAVPLKEGEERLVIPVSANVTGRLSVAPMTIVVRPPQEPNEPVQRDIIVWATDGKSLPTRHEIDVPEGWQVQHLEGTKQRQRFRLVGASAGGAHAGEVRIRFPELNESIIVKILVAENSQPPAHENDP